MKQKEFRFGLFPRFTYGKSSRAAVFLVSQRGDTFNNGGVGLILIYFLAVLRKLGPIAQLAEHRADNAGVTGASPVRPTILLRH